VCNLSYARIHVLSHPCLQEDTYTGHGGQESFSFRKQKESLDESEDSIRRTILLVDDNLIRLHFLHDSIFGYFISLLQKHLLNSTRYPLMLFLSVSLAMSVYPTQIFTCMQFFSLPSHQSKTLSCSRICSGKSCN
jgi:hypothetical protein